MHFVFIFGFEFLEHFACFGHSRLGMSLLGPSPLRHSLFDFFVDFVLTKNLHPLGWTNQDIGLLLVILGMSNLYVDIDVLNGIELFPTLEKPVDILKFTQLQQRLPQMNFTIF